MNMQNMMKQAQKLQKQMEQSQAELAATQFVGKSAQDLVVATLTGDKKVVLGLITTKSPELEDEQVIIDRINEAAKYIPLERLCLSPQCGFASCEIGNKLTEEEQWAKLRLVKKIAKKVWG